jgi:hypothetical protein
MEDQFFSRLQKQANDFQGFCLEIVSTLGWSLEKKSKSNDSVRTN